MSHETPTGWCVRFTVGAATLSTVEQWLRRRCDPLLTEFCFESSHSTHVALSYARDALFRTWHFSRHCWASGCNLQERRHQGPSHDFLCSILPTHKVLDRVRLRCLLRQKKVHSVHGTRCLDVGLSADRPGGFRHQRPRGETDRRLVRCIASHGSTVR